MLPVYAGTERQNSLVGGASLWVLKGKSDAEYKGAAAFLNFIAQPEQALFWSTNTGYIPVTKTRLRLHEGRASTTRRPTRAAKSRSPA